ncbi:MAG: hypothetical protein ABI742_05540, partial [Gemmatimonadota bacterium]
MRPLIPAVRRWNAIGRALRVILGAILLTTCSTDSALAPRWTSHSTIDAAAFFRAGGAFPIPIDEVILTLARVSDNAVVFDDTLTAAQFTQSGGQLLIQVNLDLTSATEQFSFTAIVRGAGIEYYRTTGTVTATAGQTTQTTPLTPVYTGPGNAADSVTIPATTALGNGQSATIIATVWQGLVPITGVPVAFESSDSTQIIPQSTGLSQASVTAPATGSGSITITAKTPGGQTTTGTVSWTASGSAASVAANSAVSQSAPIGTVVSAPPSVLVLDANSNPVPGVAVTFVVASGGGSLTGGGQVTNGSGIATVLSWTVGATPGPNTMTATVVGLPVVTFTATGTAAAPATVTANSAVTQNAVVNALVAAPPSVLVQDAGNLPLAGVSVTFAVASGGGSVTGAAQTTNASGIATITNWRVGQTVGANTVTATVTGLPAVTFTATGTPTAILTLVKDSGDAQTDSSLKALPIPLVVQAQDSFSNVVPGATVNWVVTDGSVAPASGTTDALGRARTVWTLGAAQATPTATASIGAAQAIFTATTLFGQPTIQLSFAGIPGVGIGLSSKVYITLNTAAPVGGTAVTLVSGNTSFFTVAPASVTIPAGQTRDSVVVSGISTGTANLTGSATGYTSGTLSIDVQNRNLSVPPTLAVPYGQTQSLPIVLPAPAPAGGVTFTVTTSDATLVGVLTPSVTIVAGGQSANATLSGVLPGTATITVSNPSYVSGVTAATTAASLNVVQTGLTINASFGSPITINFESNGAATAAPAPGIPVTLTPRLPACLAATSPVTIITGQVSTTSNLSYGGSATLPCTTYLVATATNLQPDSVQVTVNPAPIIQVNTNYPQIGSGLLEGGSISLGASNHGGVTVTVTSSDSNLIVLSTTLGGLGSGSITVPVLPLVGSFTYYAEAKEGVTGTAVVTATAPGFSPVPDTLSVIAPAIELQGLPPTTTTLSAVNNLYAQVGVPNGQLTGVQRVQYHRGGVAPIPVAFAMQSGTSVGVLIDSVTPGGAQTGQARIGASVYYSPTNGPTTGGIAFKPAGQGTDLVSVSSPGFISVGTATRGITVSQPTSSIGINFSLIGVGLMEGGNVSLSAGQHGGASVTVQSLDPTVFQVDTLINGPGHDSIVKPLTNGQQGFTYYVQVKEFSQFLSGYIKVTEPRFTPDSVLVSAVQPAIELQGLPTTTTTLTGFNNLYAQIGIPNGQLTGIQRVQYLRGGAPAPVPVTFASKPGGAGILADTLSQFTGGADTVTVIIDTTSSLYYTPTGGPNNRGVQFRPLTAGADTITVSSVGYISVGSATRVVTIAQPTSNISVNYPFIGSGLQEGGSASLSAAQHGGAAVTITSRNPAVILVDSLSNGPGGASFTKTLTNGQAGVTVYYQALPGVVDSTWVVVSEPRFAPDSILVHTVVPGIEVQGVPGQMTPFDNDANVYAQVGVLNSNNTGLLRAQNRRGGASGPLTATFTSSTAAIGLIVDSLTPGGAASGTARIAPNIYYTPTSGPVGGGIAFRPLLIGSTTVSVSMPGFITATSNGNRVVNVLQPGMNLSTNYPTIGSGLQEAGFGSLGATQHGGVTVTITSSDSTILKLSPNATTAGSGSIQIPLANGQSGFSYYVQGMEGINTTTTVTITAVASGFTNGTLGVSVDRPAVEIQGLGTSYTAGGSDVNFYAQIGLPNSQATGIQRVQVLRAGAPAALVASFSSSVPAAGTLVDSVGAGTPKTATIPNTGLVYYTPTGGP